jgi:hypothetical protein
MSRPSLDDFRLDDKLAYKLANQYAYFWRWATWKAFDAHPDEPKGLVAFISPSAWLTSAAFSGMRRYLRRAADDGWIISLTPEEHRPPGRTRIFPTVPHRICIAVFARRGQPRPGTAARVLFRELHGSSVEKIAALTTDRITPGGEGWEECPEDWEDPFIPRSGEWLSHPGLDDLMPWQHSGMKANRTWPYAPDPEILRERWDRLIATPAPQKNLMLKPSRERDAGSRPGGDHVVPGEPVPLHLQGPSAPRIEPVGFRSFDRQFVILDRRVVDYPRSELWSVAGPGQVFATASHDKQVVGGPAVTFTTWVPDMHHFDNRGGKAIPLYRDLATLTPNIAPGLTSCLARRLGVPVTPEDFLAYIAAVAAHPAYTRRFHADLRAPGVRIPFTAAVALWNEAVTAGRQVLQVHTYGHALHDLKSERPPSPARLSASLRPVTTASATTLPDSVTYDDATQEIRFGVGAVAPVPREVWDYSVGSMNVIRKWFDYRLARLRHSGLSAYRNRRYSPLDDVRAPEWGPRFTDDLIDLLNAIGTLVQLEPAQAALLDTIMEAPLVTVSDLEAEGILPVPPAWKRKPSTQPGAPLITP